MKLGAGCYGRGPAGVGGEVGGRYAHNIMYSSVEFSKNQYI